MTDFATSIEGIPIGYEVYGEGTPCLVFVHGWSCDRSYWERQLSHFARQHQVVAIDLAGHGESGADRTTWTMGAFGEDVVAVADKLGLDQIVLIGHSMGGPVIVEAARRMSQRVIALVGVDTFTDVARTRTPDQVEQSLAPLRANFLEETRRIVRNMFLPNSDPMLTEHIVADMSSAPHHVAVGAWEEFGSNYQNLRTGLQEVKAPIISINSDYRPNNTDAAKNYGIEIRLMSGVGHFVMIEDAETFNQHLEEAIRSFVRLTQ